MTRARSLLSVAGATLILGAAVTLVSSPPAHATQGPQSVLVVNGSGQPVPTLATGTTAISGNVSIDGTPNVSAAQSGSWSVSIAGTPSISGSVTVANPTSAPLPVKAVGNPADQAFQADDTVPLNAGVSNNIIAGTVVPAGKRLVIEHVSAVSGVPAGAQIQQTGIAVSLNGTYVFHYLTPVHSGSDPSTDFFHVSQPIRLYADGGTSLHFLATRNGVSIGTAVVVDFSISGYLVDMP